MDQVPQQPIQVAPPVASTPAQPADAAQGKPQPVAPSPAQPPQSPPQNTPPKKSMPLAEIGLFEVGFVVLFLSVVFFLLNFFNILLVDNRIPQLSFLPHLPRKVTYNLNQIKNQLFSYDTTLAYTTLNNYILANLSSDLAPEATPDATSVTQSKNTFSLVWGTSLLVQEKLIFTPYTNAISFESLAVGAIVSSPSAGLATSSAATNVQKYFPHAPTSGWDCTEIDASNWFCQSAATNALGETTLFEANNTLSTTQIDSLTVGMCTLKSVKQQFPKQSCQAISASL